MIDWSDVARYFSGDTVAHLATIEQDGGPHVVPLWIDRVGESELAFFTIAGSRKDRNIARDPRVGISITDPDNAYDMATVRGEVIERVDGEQGWAIIDRIARKYREAPTHSGPATSRSSCVPPHGVLTTTPPSRQGARAARLSLGRRSR